MWFVWICTWIFLLSMLRHIGANIMAEDRSDSCVSEISDNVHFLWTESKFLHLLYVLCILLGSFLFSTTNSSYSCMFLPRGSCKWGGIHQWEALLVPQFTSYLFCHMQLWHTGTFWLKMKQRKILETSTVLLISLKFRFTLREWEALSTFCSNLISILDFFLSSLPCSDNYAGSILFLSF